jgi:hypothetical protein
MVDCLLDCWSNNSNDKTLLEDLSFYSSLMLSTLVSTNVQSFSWKSRVFCIELFTIKWLYASVKLKCMLVTNDQMRDHIFELLGSSFFPMWKERHQVC